MALWCPGEGALIAPAAGAHEAADMIRMRGDAEGALDHLGHSLGGPHITAEPVGWRPTGQQRGQLRTLLRSRGEEPVRVAAGAPAPRPPAHRGGDTSD